MHLARRTALVLATALLATAFGPAEDASCRSIQDPAAPTDPGARIEFCEATGYLTSSNPAKADNLSSVGATDVPTWTTEAPGSVTGGEGAGFLGQYQSSLLVGPDEVSGVTYVGTFDGALDELAVEQYVFTAADDVNGTYGIVLDLQIDGRQVYASDFVEGDFAPIQSGGDAVDVFRFAVTDIFADVAPRDGEHTIELNITPYFVGDEAVFVYGAAEAPSTITFNPADRSGFAAIEATRG